jgi:hypothetical protein
MEVSGQPHAQTVVLLGREPSVHTEYEVGWVQDTVETLLRREKCFSFPVIQSRFYWRLDYSPSLCRLSYLDPGLNYTLHLNSNKKFASHTFQPRNRNVPPKRLLIISRLYGFISNTKTLHSSFY